MHPLLGAQLMGIPKPKGTTGATESQTCLVCSRVCTSVRSKAVMITVHTGRSQEQISNRLGKHAVPGGAPLRQLPAPQEKPREEPGSCGTARVVPQAVGSGPRYGGWEGDTPWLPLGTYLPTTLSNLYPEVSPRRYPGRKDELMGSRVQPSPPSLTAKGAQMRVLTAESLSFPICEVVRMISQALRVAVRIKQEQLFYKLLA